jgi:EAL domain-containing protein (putative c-di-GMP-specific phosphodiesterase class I)
VSLISSSQWRSSLSWICAADSVLSQVNDQNRYRFDQGCRARAIELSSRLGLPATGADLSINFMPGAVYHPEACLRATFSAAERVKFPLDRLIFEVTEGERISNPGHLASIVETYRRHNFRTAIDDFGAGYAGLNLLARFQPDIIKIDMELTRGIESRPINQNNCCCNPSSLPGTKHQRHRRRH